MDVEERRNKKCVRPFDYIWLATPNCSSLDSMKNQMFLRSITIKGSNDPFISKEDVLGVNVAKQQSFRVFWLHTMVPRCNGCAFLISFLDHNKILNNDVNWL